MFKENLNTALKNMREIDKQGTFSTGVSSETGLFESNDPTSQIFQQLLELLEELNKVVK